MDYFVLSLSLLLFLHEVFIQRVKKRIYPKIPHTQPKSTDILLTAAMAITDC